MKREIVFGTDVDLSKIRITGLYLDYKDLVNIYYEIPDLNIQKRLQFSTEWATKNKFINFDVIRYLFEENYY